MNLIPAPLNSSGSTVLSKKMKNTNFFEGSHLCLVFLFFLGGGYYHRLTSSKLLLH